MYRISLNQNWKFTKLVHGTINSPEIPEDLQETAYQEMSIPHTWFLNEDQYRGLTVYRKWVEIPADMRGKCVFLEFDGADQYCKVYVNGEFIGEHKGAYARFCLEIPQECMMEDVLMVDVFLSNEENQTISPTFGDFTIFGGLYRGVNLLVAEKEHFDYLYYGTDGVIANTKVLEHWDGVVDVEPHVVSGSQTKTRIRYQVMDESGEAVAEAYGGDDEKICIPVHSPKLWNGREDAALYTLKAQLLQEERSAEDGAADHKAAEGENAGKEVTTNKILDEVIKTIGFRSIRMDADHGFFLNENHTWLKGVSLHQDFAEVFSAVSEVQTQKNFSLIKEIGANALRLSHYQHPQRTYDICDQEGYVVWAEIPMLKMTEDQELFENARQQLTELILQNIHHPSICFWGIQNEIGMFKDAPYMHGMCQELCELAHELDDTRLVTAANLYTVKPESKLNQITDMIGYNIYFGWYYGEMKDYDKYLDQLHEKCPGMPLGVSEYGVDANPALHSANPMVRDYSEEYQALHNEIVYPIFKSKDYMWGSFIWNMFDFSSFRRDEGGVKYINQKGLVTYDRTVCKDAFYYYKSQWSEEAFVHICSKRFEKRTDDTIEIKVYTNQPSAKLMGVDDTILGAEDNHGNGTIIFSGVKLQDGVNQFTVRSENGAMICEDTAIFTRVSEEEESYRLPDSGAGQTVKNWFLSEDDLVREGYFSLKDSAYDISENPQAMEVFRKFAPVTAKAVEQEDGIPLGLTLLSILGRDQDRNPAFEMKDLNAALNQVKK